MISKDEFAELVKDHPPLSSVPEKLRELIRDELEPGEKAEWAVGATIWGVDGLVCLTEKRLLCFWMQKMFIFFKFPTIQVFDRRQLQKVEQNGNSVHLRAQADPSDPGEDYEENTLQFATASVAQQLAERLQAYSATS